MGSEERDVERGRSRGQRRGRSCIISEREGKARQGYVRECPGWGMKKEQGGHGKSSGTREKGDPRSKRRGSWRIKRVRPPPDEAEEQRVSLSQGNEIQGAKGRALTVALRLCSFPNVLGSIVPTHPSTPSSRFWAVASCIVGRTERYSCCARTSRGQHGAGRKEASKHTSDRSD